jgi:hypothetical protein
VLAVLKERGADVLGGAEGEARLVKLGRKLALPLGEGGEAMHVRGEGWGGDS